MRTALLYIRIDKLDTYYAMDTYSQSLSRLLRNIDSETVLPSSIPSYRNAKRDFKWLRAEEKISLIAAFPFPARRDYLEQFASFCAAEAARPTSFFDFEGRRLRAVWKRKAAAARVLLSRCDQAEPTSDGHVPPSGNSGGAGKALNIGGAITASVLLVAVLSAAAVFGVGTVVDVSGGKISVRSVGSGLEP